MPMSEETKAETAEEGQEGKPVEKARDSNKKVQTDERWLEWLDSKIALLINRDGVDPRDYGGKSYDEELSKALEPHVKQEDEGKYRCRNCQKLFKASSFVEKHIANKHPELIKSLDDLQYFNNFALDPHRIQPFAHVPPPVGNSSQAPPQAYGLRGPSYGEFPRYDGAYLPTGSYPPALHAPPGAGYWVEGYGGRGMHQFDPYGGPPPPPSRRDDNNARRLSDRITGFASGTEPPANAGLPPKPPPPSVDSALPSGSNNTGGHGGRKKGNGGAGHGGPPPPPPPDAKEDPRAAAGRKVSYHDMDLVAEGDVELTY